MVSLNLILFLIFTIGFVSFGGTKFTIDIIQSARNELKIAKAGLASDPVTDIQTKTAAGMAGQEG